MVRKHRGNFLDREIGYFNAGAFVRSLTREELFAWVRGRLGNNRLNMTSGFEADNMAIVNLFADTGIYYDVDYLFLKYHKGCGNIFIKRFRSSEKVDIELGGETTAEVIVIILENTVLL